MLLCMIPRVRVSFSFPFCFTFPLLAFYDFTASAFPGRLLQGMFVGYKHNSGQMDMDRILSADTCNQIRVASIHVCECPHYFVCVH